MVKMTFENYDELTKYFDGMVNPTPEYYPTHEAILKGINENERQFIRYLLFLEHTGTDNTEEGKEGKRRVKNALHAVFSMVHDE